MRRLLVIAAIVLGLPAAGAAAPDGAGGGLLFLQHAPLPRYVSTFFVCASAPDGIRPMRVVDILALWNDGFAVSDDGSRIAWSSGGNLHVAAVDGTNKVRIGFGTKPAWTPDGTQIVYAGPKGLQMMQPDGSGETVLATPGDWPAVSPDGRTIAFVRGEHLVLLDRPAGTERIVFSQPLIAAPDWAPDGSTIVVTVGGAVHSVRPDGTGLAALTSGTGDSEPAYSPDGTRIAFERGDDIWLITASGGDPINVTRTPLPESAPDWQAATAATQAGSDRPCAIVGTEGDDHLVGSEYGDFIYDLGGDDTVRGLGGDDVVFGGAGDDRIDGGDGPDTIWLGGGRNVVHGGGGDDVIGAWPYNVPVPASDSQILFGGDGNDRLTGSNRRDLLDGGGGNDFLIGFGGDDTLAGGDGADRLFGVDGNDRLAGGPDDDQLGGGTGTDVFLGGSGNDHLLARDGRPELVDGGPGRDRAQHDRADRRVRVERTIP